MVRSHAGIHTDVRTALRDMITAHEAIMQGIATHAEKHEAAVDAKREEVRRQHAISAGIAKHSGQV